jgi:hypothetical protein
VVVLVYGLWKLSNTGKSIIYKPIVKEAEDAFVTPFADGNAGTGFGF